MKKILISLCGIVLFFNSFSQNYTEIDSLKHLFISAKSDSDKAKLLWQITGWYAQSPNATDSTLAYALKWNSQVESSKIKDIGYGEINSLNFLSDLFIQTGDYKKAISYSLKLLVKSENQSGINFLNHINALVSLSEIYYLTQDYENSIKYANQILATLTNQLKLSSEQKDASELFYFSAYSLLGDSYIKLDKDDSAFKYYNQYLELLYANLQRYRNSTLVIEGNKNLGQFYLKKRETTLAFSFFNKAFFAINNPYNEVEDITSLCLGLANAHILIGNLDSALKYSRLAYLTSKNAKYTNGIIESCKVTSVIFESKNKYDSAYFYKNEETILKDSIRNEETLRNISLETIEENFRQQKIQQEKEKAKEEKIKYIKLGLIAIFIPIFALTVYLISRKKKNNIKIVTMLGLTSLLMFFEYITMLIHPFVEKITNHDVLIMYLILLCIASILVPIHHKLESYVKSRIQPHSHTSDQKYGTENK